MDPAEARPGSGHKAAIPQLPTCAWLECLMDLPCEKARLEIPYTAALSILDLLAIPSSIAASSVSLRLGPHPIAFAPPRSADEAKARNLELSVHPEIKLASSQLA
nr:hypothetical protein CFP56_29947 [Quercus suber]